MSIPRRRLMAALGSASTLPFLLPFLARRALAAYPDRSIHLIVPFAAGGNADIDELRAARAHLEQQD